MLKIPAVGFVELFPTNGRTNFVSGFLQRLTQQPHKVLFP